MKKVQVSENKDSYVLEENSDGATWNVSGDGSSDKESADTTAAGNVTSGLGSFAFDQFVNYNAEDLSQYGLDKPYATITVDYQEEVKNDSTDSTESEKTILRPLRTILRAMTLLTRTAAQKMQTARQPQWINSLSFTLAMRQEMAADM